MIPSLFDQVVAARIPRPCELTAAERRKEALDHMLDVMRSYGNLTAQRAHELTDKPERTCRNLLSGLERKGLAYSWKGRPREPRMWGVVK